MPAGSPQPANPLVKIAVAGAGTIAAMLANQILEKGWGAVFGEKPPSEKMSKQSTKDLKAERRSAKKDGASKQEIAQISDPLEDFPLWKVLLWTALSGIAIQGLRLAAERVAQKGTARFVERRPHSNRG